MLRATSLAAIFLVTAPLAVRAEPQIAARSRRSPDLHVLADGTGQTLVRGGAELPLALPAHARIEAVMAIGDGWMVAGSAESAPDQRDLIVVEGGPAGSHVVPTPRRTLGSTALLPSLVSDRSDALAGLAWLEGEPPGRYAVRWAAWDGSAFGRAVTVAAAGPGSQTALTGTRLADGRALLVWAGFDGEDDEIWASLSGPRGWSQPQRISTDNRVPDITPTVNPTADGALVVWSRFDGSEYRLAAARFDGTRFRDLGYIAPPGSLFPSFEGEVDAPTLLFRDARAQSWAAAEVAPDGALGRTARFAGDPRERPLVTAGARHVVWSVGRSSQATDWQ